MRTITLLMLLSASLLVDVLGQSCQQGSGIVRLLNVDTCRNIDAFMECTSKMQITTSPMCAVKFQSDNKVSSDGHFCESSNGLLQRGAASGKWLMGKSDIDFDLKTINNPAYANMLLLHLKGRIVPDEGGRETQVDCNLLLNVTAGSVLGIVSTGQDSLMSTTYTGPALPATTTEAAEASQQTGTYSNGMGQMQQQGRTGMQNGMMTGVQQQQQGTIGMQNGQMGAGNPYTAATSSASKVSARTGVMTVLLGGLFLALGL